MSPRPAQSTALIVIAVCAAVWFLQTASHVMAPLLLALVVGVVTAPVGDLIEKIGLRRSVSAFVVLFSALTAVVLLGLLLVPVITDAVEMAPRIKWELRKFISTLQPAIESVTDMQASIEDSLSPGSDPVATPTDAPSLTDAIWLAPGFFAQVMIFAGSLYFFLLSRNDLYRIIAHNTSRVSEEVLCAAERDVSRYFLTITAINAAFGLIIGLVMATLGMPNPFLWGIGAFLVNYLLYLGPIAFAVTLLIAGFVTFEGAWSFLPAALYLSLNATEGQFVTPSLVGRHMSINPLAVFVSLIFWLWLWGPVGGVIAIPVLVWGLNLREAHTGPEPESDTKIRSVAAG